MIVFFYYYYTPYSHCDLYFHFYKDIKWIIYYFYLRLDLLNCRRIGAHPIHSGN